MSTAILRALAEDLADTVSRQYRLAREDALNRILDAWSADAALRAAAERAGDARALARQRVFKDAASAAKAKIYADLRRYRTDGFAGAVAAFAALPADAGPDEAGKHCRAIGAQHASCAERLPHLGEFHDRLLRLMADAYTVLDVGAGVMPLLFPFARSPRISRYLACERDAAAVQALEAFAARRGDAFSVRAWSIADGWEPLLRASGIAMFDVALMLKLVPVVARQEPEHLAILAAVPARRIVVSGSREAMAKRRSIARRERAVLDDFIAGAGWRVTAESETPDEFFLAVERG